MGPVYIYARSRDGIQLVVDSRQMLPRDLNDKMYMNIHHIIMLNFSNKDRLGQLSEMVWRLLCKTRTMIGGDFYFHERICRDVFPLWKREFPL